MTIPLPRTVYRVVYDKKGMPFVIEREMIAHSRSWVTTRRKDGTTEKENGNRWSDTILDAMQQAAIHMLYRFSLLEQTVGVTHKQQIEAMNALIKEAVEWGKLLGDAEATLRFVKSTKNNLTPVATNDAGATDDGDLQ